MKIYPKAYFGKVEEITIEFLKKNKLKALILDVDNTLIDKERNMSEKVIEWVRNLKGQGVKLYILSNSNNAEKVEEISQKLKVPYYKFAMKPFKRGFKKALKELNEKAENTAIVGDQIFTDIIGGNRCSIYTILVDPIKEKEFWYTAWKRPIENRIKGKLDKNSKNAKEIIN